MRIAFLLSLILVGCSGLEQSEQENLRKRNCKGEYIYRRQDSVLFSIPSPKSCKRESYPWESDFKADKEKAPVSRKKPSY